MELSIVILSWNTLELTRNCLRSIFDNAKDLECEVIVVDNGSQDGSPEMIEKEFPQVKLIKNNYNSGFTKGNNQGFRASRGEYVLFLNSDTIIPPLDKHIFSPVSGCRPIPPHPPSRQPNTGESYKSQLHKMVDKMKDDVSIGMLTPKLVYPDGRFQDEYYRKLPSLAQTFWVYLFPFNKLTHSVKFLRRRYLSDVNPDKSGYITDYNVPGAAPIISRAAYEKISGRDENIFYWMEDIDLFWSMQKAGYKMYYLAEATIIHLGGMSNIMWDDLRKMLDFRRGYLYVFRKHKGKFQGFIVKWMFILNALVSAPFLMLCGIFGKKYWKKGIAALKFVWKF
jgi:GT2 family glycosyltransferase